MAYSAHYRGELIYFHFTAAISQCLPSQSRALAHNVDHIALTRAQSTEEERKPNVWDDAGDDDLIALFVLDEIPVAVSSTLSLNCTHH